MLDWDQTSMVLECKQFLVSFLFKINVISVIRTPHGLEDTSKFPNLIAALIEDPTFNWTDEEFGKLASGNIIRVFHEVEAVKESLSDEEPYQYWIPSEDLNPDEITCNTQVD